MLRTSRIVTLLLTSFFLGATGGCSSDHSPLSTSDVESEDTIAKAPPESEPKKASKPAPEPVTEESVVEMDGIGKCTCSCNVASDNNVRHVKFTDETRRLLQATPHEVSYCGSRVEMREKIDERIRQAAELSQRLLQRHSLDYNSCDDSRTRLASDISYWRVLALTANKDDLWWVSLLGTNLFRIKDKIDEIDEFCDLSHYNARMFEKLDDDLQKRLNVASKLFENRPISLVGNSLMVSTMKMMLAEKLESGRNYQVTGPSDTNRYRLPIPPPVVKRIVPDDKFDPGALADPFADDE